jgi:hypothetical protein
VVISSQLATDRIGETTKEAQATSPTKDSVEHPLEMAVENLKK